MTAEWAPSGYGPGNQIRVAMLEDIGRRMATQQSKLDIPLIEFNREAPYATKRGAADVIGFANCLKLESEEVEGRRTNLSVVLSLAVQSTLANNTSLPLSRIVRDRCQSARRPESNCKHLDICPIIQILAKSEKEKEADSYRVEVVDGFGQIFELREFYTMEYAAFHEGYNQQMQDLYLDRVVGPYEFEEALETQKWEKNNKTLCIRDTDENIMGWGDACRTVGKENYFTVDYYIGYQYRGKGLGTKLINEIVRYVRDDLEGNGLYINIKAHNKASLKACLKGLSKHGLVPVIEEEQNMIYLTVKLK